MAAGSVVITEETVGSVKKVSFAWTSGTDAEAGTAGDTTDYTYNGVLERLVTVPDGTAAPSDDYDVVVNDADGTDVLMGAGADRDTADTEQVLASSLGCVANDKLTLAITNAGAAKEGVVNLYIR